MKVLFLDIDGVLNGYPFWTERDTDYEWKDESLCDHDLNMINPECVSRLNKVIEATGCKVVLSSTWRLLHSVDEMQSILKLVGDFNGEIIDRTVACFKRPPNEYRDKNWSCRGEEIQLWLDEHPEVVTFAVVDDDGDMGPVLDRWVKTSLRYNGIQDEQVELLIEMLEGKR